jgi:hypothetical protein
MNKRTTVLIAFLVFFYALISVFCFSVISISWISAFIDRNWNYVWILGPASALIYRFERGYFLFYTITTVILSVLLVWAIKTNSLAGKVRLALAIIIFWALAGLIVFGIAI